MNSPIFRRECVNGRSPLSRHYLQRSSRDRDVPGHGHHFQIDHRDGTAFLVGDERVPARSVIAPRAGGGQGKRQKGTA